MSEIKAIDFMILESNNELIFVIDHSEIDDIQSASFFLANEGMRSSAIIEVPGSGKFALGPFAPGIKDTIENKKIPFILMDTKANIIKDVELIKISV